MGLMPGLVWVRHIQDKAEGALSRVLNTAIVFVSGSPFHCDSINFSSSIVSHAHRGRKCSSGERDSRCALCFNGIRKPTIRMSLNLPAMKNNGLDGGTTMTATGRLLNFVPKSYESLFFLLRDEVWVQGNLKRTWNKRDFR
jgi:hypothetical protein